MEDNPAVRSAFALFLAVAAGCSSAVQPRATPDRVTGLIVTVERDQTGAIEAFTVVDGRRLRVRIDARRDYGFDLEHLEEHRADRLPVTVSLEERDDDLYAVEILDA